MATRALPHKAAAGASSSSQTGNAAKQTTGEILQVTISNTLVERLFPAFVGTAIGATDLSNNPDGSGLIGLVLLDLGSGANWKTEIDRANLGESSVTLSDSTSPGASQPTVDVIGSTYGSNSASVADTANHIFSGNGESIRGIYAGPNWTVGSFTGVTGYDIVLDSNRTANRLSSFQRLNINGYNGPSANNYGIFDAGGALNHWEGPMQFTEAAAPTGWTVGAGLDTCYADSSAHGLKCSFNGGSFQPIAITGKNGVSAGTIRLSSGVGSHTFAAAYGTPPVCIATDTTSAAVVRVSSSRTAISVSGTGGDVIAWVCAPESN